MRWMKMKRKTVWVFLLGCLIVSCLFRLKYFVANAFHVNMHSLTHTNRLKKSTWAVGLACCKKMTKYIIEKVMDFVDWFAKIHCGFENILPCHRDRRVRRSFINSSTHVSPFFHYIQRVCQEKVWAIKRLKRVLLASSETTTIQRLAPQDSDENFQSFFSAWSLNVMEWKNHWFLDFSQFAKTYKTSP